MDVGTVVWLLFFALLAYALLARAAEFLLDVASWARDAATSRSHPAFVVAAEPEDHFPWTDAQTVRFTPGDDDSDDDDWTREPWVAPLAPDGSSCAVCGGPLLPVLYGYPSGGMIEAAQAGTIILGGCCPGSERYRCPRCADAWWSRPPSANSGQDPAFG